MDNPPELVAILLHFSVLFSSTTWRKGQLLAVGALLCPRQRTVAAALRLMGREKKKDYGNYHRVLNRDKWSAFLAGKILLGLLIQTGLCIFPGYLIVVFDETLERRSGKKIKAKGCYRDAVRSSKTNVIKSFGLKWVCATVILQLPWCKRPWAVPYLSVLAHSKKANKGACKKHRTCIDIAALMVVVTMRWLGFLGTSSRVIFLGDGGYAAVKFMWTCINSQATLICRLRLDSALYGWPSSPPTGKRGRKAKKGKRQASLKQIAEDPSSKWIAQEVLWYGEKKKNIEYLSGKSLWYTSGYDPVPIRWVVIRIPETGRVEAICSTDLSLSQDMIMKFFLLRWNIEVLFEEVRRHLGVETQRQWSDLAIERTTPCLFALFSIATLYGLQLWKSGKIEVHSTAWYKKEEATFSDILAAVRLDIIGGMNYTKSGSEADTVQFPTEIVRSLMHALASAA